MDSEIQKVLDESEKVVEKEDAVQEGGAQLNASITDTFLVNAAGSTKTVSQFWNIINSYDTRIGNKVTQPIKDSLDNPIQFNGVNVNDKPLLLSDLLSLSDPSSLMSAIFDKIPLAQYKHLPDPSYLHQSVGGGAMDESSLPSEESQEVSLPSEQSQESEEQLPSLDIVEPSSTGGSYKWSSHKKRKSTRIRTKKNKSKK